MKEVELMHPCEVCHISYADSALIAVEGIAYLQWERTYPWYICCECAEKISDALKCKNENVSKPLTEEQKKYIKLLLGDGYAKCTDGYLMTKLGIFDWKDAQKFIEQYEREGMKE